MARISMKLCPLFVLFLHLFRWSKIYFFAFSSATFRYLILFSFFPFTLFHYSLRFLFIFFLFLLSFSIKGKGVHFIYIFFLGYRYANYLIIAFVLSLDTVEGCACKEKHILLWYIFFTYKYSSFFLSRRSFIFIADKIPLRKAFLFYIILYKPSRLYFLFSSLTLDSV